MAPAGPPPAAGDAILGLPTLVHRGPGNFERPTERMVLFFTIKARSPRLIAEINSRDELERPNERMVLFFTMKARLP